MTHPLGVGTNNPVIEIDYSAAKSSGVPIMRVDNVEDFVAAMAQLENMFSSTDVYTLNSHGYQGTYDNPTHFYIGSDMITPENDFTNLKEGFQGRTIFIGACNVGCLSGRGFDLVENMSRQTNSRVIAPNHPLLAGYHYDGSDYLNRQNSNILTLPTTNEFIISTRGSDFDFIHNLRIDKNTGISWDGSFWNTITYFMKNQTSTKQ